MNVIPDFRDIPVRFSVLKAYGRSAMHGYHARTTEMKETASMQKGTATDAMIFGHRKVLPYPGAVRRGKEYDQFVLDNPDTEILTQKDYDTARYMADAVLNAEHAKEWMIGVTQQTLMFEYVGLHCRCTPDIRGDGFVTELKTCRDASDYRFPWQARSMGYPVQLWMQKIGCELNGYPIKRQMIVAVESTRPCPVTVFELTERSQDKAAKQLMLWAERLKVCEASGMFPPYSQAIVPLDEPEEDVELVYTEEDEAA